MREVESENSSFPVALCVSKMLDVDEHDLEAPWLCDVSHGNSYIL